MLVALELAWSTSNQIMRLFQLVFYLAEQERTIAHTRAMSQSSSGNAEVQGSHTNTLVG